MSLILLLLGCSNEPRLSCGKEFCNPAQYCRHDPPDSDDPFNEPYCADAPSECGPHITCECLPLCDQCDDAGPDAVDCTLAPP
jgi:hypothetical protein